MIQKLLRAEPDEWNEENVFIVIPIHLSVIPVKLPYWLLGPGEEMK